MSLSDSVHKFIEKDKLFAEDDLLLCAVSGGMDSMVMITILSDLGYNLEVAHINFRLRGDDSSHDERFVQNYCKEKGLICHVRRITEKERTYLQSGNLQEKARKMRYSWFENLRIKIRAKYILTAHHEGDVAETFLINTLRGSGISGLKSITSATGAIRRPLIRVSKKEIQDYQQKHKIPYQQDKTNLESYYIRNFLRNEILSKIKERYPTAEHTISKSAELMKKDYDLLESLIENEKKRWIQEKRDQVILRPLSEFRKLPHFTTLSFHLLKKYGFTYSTILDATTQPHQPGKIFYGNEFRALIDRDTFLITPIKEEFKIKIAIVNIGDFDCPLGLLKIFNKKVSNLNNNIIHEHVDATKIKWPLQLRNWSDGDKIQPLGMDGSHKKVSDILTDKKINLFQKEKQLVLCDSDGEIIWLVGLTLSDKVKYSKNTLRFLTLVWNPK